MNYLSVKNWAEFQHYKDRNPPWIKLHRTLLDDYEFSCLRDASKAHLMLIWVFASQCEGRIPNDPKFLMRKLGLDSQPDLQELVKHGFLVVEQSASTPLAPDASNLRLETEAYKATEKHTAAAASPRGKVIPEGWKPKPETLTALSTEIKSDASAYVPFFTDYCVAHAKTYRDFDAAFRNCVRQDWPKLRQVPVKGGPVAVDKLCGCGTSLRFGGADGLCNSCWRKRTYGEAA